jgi:hypothetical protein
MADPQTWLRESADELVELLAAEGHSEEPNIQRWLERHPAFVPGARGPTGRASSPPWPSAVITQPRLTGLVGKVPDFCWLAADSAFLTAVLIEIETPAKQWQHDADAVQAAPLTQAREQLVAWRAWFSEAINEVRFLDEYLVPNRYRDLLFRQHYVLIHGSRSEYESNRVRTRQRAAGMSAPDEELMSFDRLPEIPTAEAAHFGSVSIGGAGFNAVAVPPTWDPDGCENDALQRTRGYERAVRESDMTAPQQEQCIEALNRRFSDESPSLRFRPSRSVRGTPRPPRS